ncbi:zinc ABC transporter substrate-binding protein [Aurantimonas sp. A2-1-M11]|uniref:zinc ABC transporter substrate-binding protein n=1 Tax=Aurantimonas sp. A2-1-M11 TaxID=3113712 RepID=UPI002F931ECB
MRNLLPLLLASAATLAAHAPAAADAPRVVTSIKPIHSLVAAVMEGVGEPALIVPGAASPHTYSMKPSDAANLQAADVVFWIGDGLEAFLVKPIGSLAGEAKAVELIDAPGLETLPVRDGGAFEAHDHEGDDHDGHEQEGDEHQGHEHEEAGHEGHDHAPAGEEAHDHSGIDMHAWLDPLNAGAMVRHIATTLSEADPDNAERYTQNADRLEERLETLVAKTREQLADVRDKPFIVFHDAYQYFEHRFDMAAAGSITISPDRMPGVQRIAEIQETVRRTGATCVFAEPQFEPQLVDVAIEGSEARAGVLDPEGVAIPEGPELYFTLISDLSQSLQDCLSSK